MSILNRIRTLKDNILLRGLSDPNHWILRIVGGGTSAGITVTADKALKVSAAYACIGVLARQIASLPLMIYQRTGENEKKVASDHYLYPLLHDAPNQWMTSFEWREGMIAHLNLNGESFNHKVMDSKGVITDLIPLNPVNMKVSVINGEPRYEYTYEDQHIDKFPPEKIWHLKNMPISSDFNGNAPEGIRGLSPISAAKESLGLALASDDHGGRFFSNGAALGLVVKFPDGVKLSTNAKDFLKESLAEYAKPENKFKSIILDQGGTLEKIGMSNEDSQFLETRQFQVEEICRIFGVPPILIGHPGNTMTYASAEQLFLSFAIYTIRPLCVRIEQSMNHFLLSEKDRKQYYIEFNLSGLLRGDTTSRFNAYSIARQWGWMNVDEIRALENMNPLPGGKGMAYLQPMNMTEPGKKPPKPKPEPIPEQKGGNEDA